MTSLEQLSRKVREYETASGERWRLRRPNLTFRVECFEFVRAIDKLREDEEAVREMIDLFAEFMVKWLRFEQPEITREQVMESFDLDDIPRITTLLVDFQAEIDAMLPPGTPQPSETPTRKRTGAR